MVDGRETFWMLAVVLCSGVVFGCATQQPVIAVQGGLTQQELSYHNDPFDELRQDLWDMAGIVYLEDQLQNFQSADMVIEDGQFVIRTVPGAFSKGGLGSNFKLRGDYDLQIDCRLDFLEDGGDSDQILGVSVLEEGPAGGRVRLWVSMSLVKMAGKESGIFTAYREGKVLHDKSWHPVGDFNGSFRFVRIGDEISVYYRRADGGWKRANVYPSTGGDTHLGLVVQNFGMDRKSIGATRSVVGRFDNFRINGAHEIIEPEI